MSMVAVGLGVAAVVGAVGGALVSSNASGNAIEAEQRQRQESIALGRQYGQMSPGEIASINQMMTRRTQYYNMNMAVIDKQQKKLDAMAPQVGQAGQNLLELLNGKASAMLAPITRQREIQRNNLVSQLSSQMGGGWAQSSAGIQAMTMFDEGTDMTMAQAQMSALGQATQTYSTLFGQEFSGQATIAQATMEANAQDQNVAGTILQAEQYGTTRMANAVQGGVTSSPINYANQPLNALAQGANTLGGLAANQYGQQQQLAYQSQQNDLNRQMFGKMFQKPTGVEAGDYSGTSAGTPTSLGSIS